MLDTNSGCWFFCPKHTKQFPISASKGKMRGEASAAVIRCKRRMLAFLSKAYKQFQISTSKARREANMVSGLNRPADVLIKSKKILTTTNKIWLFSMPGSSLLRGTLLGMLGGQSRASHRGIIKLGHQI